MSQKEISIIIPVFNEEKNIPLIFDKLMEIFIGLSERYRCEIIFVDDGSFDKGPEIIEGLASHNNNVKYIQFSRNFGKEFALSAGLDAANGDAVVMIDADLQHPVELIPDFIQRWQNGAEVVVGVRKKNNGKGFAKKVCSLLFYKIMSAVGDTKITPSATDFRLLDRKVVLEFRRFTEHGRITRGLVDWLGFKREYIYFDANERINGKAGYSFWKLFRLAVSTFVSLSLLPMKFVGYMGFAITFFSGCAGLYILIGKYFLRAAFASTFSDAENLAIFIVFLVGIILMSIGLVAVYISSIQREVTNRPIYVIRKKKI